MNIIQALTFKYPGAKWEIKGDWEYKNLTWLDPAPKPTEEELQAAWEEYLIKKSQDLRNAKFLELEKEKERRSFEQYNHAFQHGVFTQVIAIQNKDLIALKAGEKYTLTEEEKDVMRDAGNIQTKVNHVLVKAANIKQIMTPLNDMEIAAFNVKDESLWVE